MRKTTRKNSQKVKNSNGPILINPIVLVPHLLLLIM